MGWLMWVVCGLLMFGPTVPALEYRRKPPSRLSEASKPYPPSDPTGQPTAARVEPHRSGKGHILSQLFLWGVLATWMCAMYHRFMR